jgi:hypothetical protein
MARNLQVKQAVIYLKNLKLIFPTPGYKPWYHGGPNALISTAS